MSLLGAIFETGQERKPTRLVWRVRLVGLTVRNGEDYAIVRAVTKLDDRIKLSLKIPIPLAVFREVCKVQGRDELQIGQTITIHHLC